MKKLLFKCHTKASIFAPLRRVIKHHCAAVSYKSKLSGGVYVRNAKMH